MTGITSNPENLIAWLLDHTHLEIPDVEPVAKPVQPTQPTPVDTTTCEEDESVNEGSSDDDSADNDSDSFDYDFEDTIPQLGMLTYCLFIYSFVISQVDLVKHLKQLTSLKVLMNTLVMLVRTLVLEYQYVVLKTVMMLGKEILVE